MCVFTGRQAIIMYLTSYFRRDLHREHLKLRWVLVPARLTPSPALARAPRASYLAAVPCVRVFSYFSYKYANTFLYRLVASETAMGFGAGVHSQEQVIFGGTLGGLSKSLGETQFLLKAAPPVTQRLQAALSVRLPAASAPRICSPS